MSNYHFGDDYDLNYYPQEASDSMGGVDWDKVERVEIEFDVYVKERTCKQVLTDCNDGLMPPFTAHCSACGDEWGFTPNYCPNCGAKVVR